MKNILKHIIENSIFEFKYLVKIYLNINLFSDQESRRLFPDEYHTINFLPMLKYHYYAILNDGNLSSEEVNQLNVSGITFIDEVKESLDDVSVNPLDLRDLSINFPNLILIDNKRNEYGIRTNFTGWKGSAPKLMYIEGRRFSWKRRM